jgi:exonuclease I
MHIKIIDEDYFDVDFSFEGVTTDPKAIYIKRKHFKDINPKLLNPENVLTTRITQQHIKANLRQEPRFTSLFDC